MSDTEDSRAASLGRKRRQNPDVVQSARDAEKRRKLDDNANFVALDSDDNSETVSEDRESGEVSSPEGSTHSPNPDQSHDGPPNTGLRPQERAENPSSARKTGAPATCGRLVVDAIYPDSFQKFVREQLEESNGLDSAAAVVDEYSQTNKPHRKNAAQFLHDFADGYQKSLGDYDFLELQRLVKDKDAFRKPLAVQESSKFNQDFNIILQTGCEKAPWKPRAEVAFDLLMLHKTHKKASRLLKQYLAENLIPGKDRSNAQPDSAKQDVAKQDIAKQDVDSADEDDMIEVRNNIHLSELSKDDLKDQAHYFNLTDPAALVRCLSCGKNGHNQPSCPAHQCTHCRSKSHFSRTCPSHQKCSRCRQRGHRSAQCSRSSKLAGGIGDECDVCGERGHAEEECSGIWLTFKPTRDNVKVIPEAEMAVSCYNCGRATHWGDDCPALPDFVADFITFDTWSDKNARRYVAGRGNVGGERESVSRQDQERASGGLPQHQVAMLGEWA